MAQEYTFDNDRARPISRFTLFRSDTSQSQVATLFKYRFRNRKSDLIKSRNFINLDSTVRVLEYCDLGLILVIRGECMNLGYSYTIEWGVGTARARDHKSVLAVNYHSAVKPLPRLLKPDGARLSLAALV